MQSEWKPLVRVANSFGAIGVTVLTLVALLYRLDARRGAPEGVSAAASPHSTSLASPGGIAASTSVEDGPASIAFDVVVVARAADGSDLGPVEGAAVYSVDRPGGPHAGTPVTSPIIRGRLLLRGEAGAVIRFVDLTVWHQKASARSHELTLDLASQARLEVDVSYERPLVVVDETTHQPLGEVRVLASHALAEDAPYPGPDAREQQPLAHGPSPVRMPVPESANTYWIGAPGYAWQRIVYEGSSGPPAVALRRGGGLNVRIEGADRHERPVACTVERVTEDGAYAFVTKHAVATDGAERLDGLVPGSYRVSLRPAGNPLHTVVLGEGFVDVRADSIERVELEIPPAEAGTHSATVGGELRCGRLREAKEVTMEVRAIDGDPSLEPRCLQIPRNRFREVGAETYMWTAGELDPGAYEIRLWPFGTTEKVELAAGEARQLSMRCDGGAVLLLRCVDERTREPLFPRRVFVRPYEGTAADLRQFSGDYADGITTGLLPAGRWSTTIMMDGYQIVQREIELREGANDLEIPFQRVDTVILEVGAVSQGAELILPADVWSRCKVVDAGGQSVSKGMRLGKDGTGPGTAFASSYATFWLRGKGSYEVVFPAVEGYATVEPTKVGVTTGRARAQVVLERSK